MLDRLAAIVNAPLCHVFYGTHQGEFMSVAPTGRRVTFRGLSLDRVVDGKIVQSIVEMDLEDVLR